jgi:hypothetical protein
MVVNAALATQAYQHLQETSRRGPPRAPGAVRVLAPVKMVPFEPKAQCHKINNRVNIAAAVVHAALQNSAVLVVEKRCHDHLYGATVRTNFAGLEKDDQLVEANGLTVLGDTLEEALGRLRDIKAQFPDDLVTWRVFRPDEEDAARQRAFVAMPTTAPQSAAPPMAATVVPVSPVSWCLSGGVVAAALGKKEREEKMFATGHRIWPNKFYAARVATRHSLTAAELRALEVQEKLRWMQTKGAELKATLADARLAPAARAWHGLAIVAQSMDTAAELHFDEPRVALDAESKRRRKRLMSKTVRDVVQFLGGSMHRRTQDAVPTLLMGQWAMDHASRGFAMKEFIKTLAKHVIVIVANENRTTISCTWCGSVVQHPAKGGGNVVGSRAEKNGLFRGTVYCTERGCPGRGRLFGRDTAAAINIAGRFGYEFILGGELGRVPLWGFSC